MGDLSKFSVFGDDTCGPNALAVKTGDALTKTKVTDDTFGAMTQEVKFVEKFRLGMPERVGWVLLFRSMMYASDNPPYMVLAENGGEWDEESARNGAGQVNTLSAAGGVVARFTSWASFSTPGLSNRTTGLRSRSVHGPGSASRAIPRSRLRRCSSGS